MDGESQGARPRHSEEKWRVYNEFRMSSLRKSVLPLAAFDAILLLSFARSGNDKSFGSGITLGLMCLATWACVACWTASSRIEDSLDRDALYWEGRVTLAWKIGIALSAGLLVLAVAGLLLDDALATPAFGGWALPIGATGAFMAYRMWARRADPTDVFKVHRIG